MDTKKNFETDEDNIILLPDLDDALIGIGERIGIPPIAIYDSQKCVEILMERLNIEYEDAVEFFNFNISGAYLGEYTPIFIRFPE
ncbi:hypothetical protein [Turicibacter sp. T129]|uniref:hypothetical protein n=1 Tax=Turicibacter sp. T129 TaxID=2951141 RepID=UPI0021D4CA7D|nr:hypothetical protein [Turicibacter sp. T129]MCU7193059.1 hypothetical protein [Turicibacter sp. T129]